jgi:hypothetical protein
MERVPLMGGSLSFVVEDGRCVVHEHPDGLTIVPEPRDRSG